MPIRIGNSNKGHISKGNETTGRALAAHTTGNQIESSKIDYRFPIMIKDSGRTPESTRELVQAQWESLRDEWDIIWYAHFSEPITDEFNNYPEKVFRFLHKETGNDILMGEDDALYLFRDSDKEEQIRKLTRQHKKLKGIGRVGKTQPLMQYYRDRLFFNLETNNFHQKALNMIRSIPALYVMGISPGLASLLYLREFLSIEDRVRLGGIIDKFGCSGEANLTSQELNFIVYKPKDIFMDYNGLKKHFPLLQYQVNQVHDQILAKKTSSLWNKAGTISKPGEPRKRTHTALLKEEKEKLQEKEKFSYLRIYEMECNYREDKIIDLFA